MSYLPNFNDHQIEITASRWSDVLTAETARIEETGVKAAILSIQHGDLDERQTRQLHTLFQRSLTPADRPRIAGDGSLTALLTPVDGLGALQHRLRRLHKAARGHGLEIHIAFALRRPKESLLDTWARADAELDRSRSPRMSSAVTNLTAL